MGPRRNQEIDSSNITKTISFWSGSFTGSSTSARNDQNKLDAGPAERGIVVINVEPLVQQS